MIADDQTDTVYVSDLLLVRHPSVYRNLKAALGGQLRIIPGTRDIWCRDYMPIQVDVDRYVQFRYAPDYLVGYEHIRTKDAASLLGLPNCVRSDLVIDGGNVVHHRNTAIVTDKIYKENPGIEKSHLREQLQAALEIDRLVVIPHEPYDKIGHADGMVRFVDEKTLLVNDYSKYNPAFGKRLAAALRGFEMITLPYCPSNEVSDGIPSAEGAYANYLQLEKFVCVPRFDGNEDDQAAGTISRAFPNSKVFAVQSGTLAAQGGVLNCMTWNIKSRSTD